MKHRMLALLLSALLLLGALTGCTAKTQQPAADAPAAETPAAETPAAEEPAAESPFADTSAAPENQNYREKLNLIYPDDIPTWDPYGTTHTATAFVCNMMYDQVVEQNYEGELVPRLAESWADVSDGQDGTVWELKLAQNARFHDGTPLTAADVQFTLEYCGADAGNVARSIPLTTYIQSYETVDDYTLRLHLTRPMADLPYYLNFFVLSKNAYDTLPAEEACLLGSGPFEKNEAESIPGISFSVKRFEDYWGSLADYPSRIVTWKVIYDYNTIQAALEAREIDLYASFPASMLAGMRLNPVEGLSDMVYDSTTLVYMGFNHSREALQDVQVRRAICMAINRDDIDAIAFENGLGGVSTDNICIPSALGHVEVDGVPYDPAGAKALLEEAGYGDIHLVLAHYHYLAAFAQVIQSNLAAAGIDCELVEADATTWVATKTAMESYDLYVDFVGAGGAMMYNFDRMYRTGGNSNLTGFSSAEYDALNDAVLNAPNFDEMKAQFADLQQWVADNVPTFPLGVLRWNIVYWDNTGGLPKVGGANDTNYRTAYALEQ